MANIPGSPPQFLQKLEELGKGLSVWWQRFFNSLNTTQSQVNSAIQVVGLTVTNNSPGGGQIAWSACTVYYNGAAYSIAAGNSSTNQFVWWVVGASTFSSGNTFTPGPTIFPILTNTAGTSDLTWNKVGAGSIKGAHLGLSAGIYNGPNGVLTLDGVTFTDGQPVSTSVQWSAGLVTYQGVSYSLSAGNADSAHIFIYWQLSSPTAFQTATSYPALGADDFLIGFNNPSGNPSASGHFARAWQVKQANGQTIYVAADAAISARNAENNPVFALQRSATDGVGAPAAGNLFLFDGNGNTNVQLNGSNGVIQLRNTSGTPIVLTNISLPAGKVAQNLFFAISVNGTTYYLPLYQ